MRSTLHAALIASAALGAAVQTACGGSDLTLPSEGEPATLAVVSGDTQSGRVGDTLAAPLVVRVSDTKDRPVVGTKVVFAIAANGAGAALEPDTATTGNDGEASSRLTLGTAVGAVKVAARVMGSSDPKLATAFTLTALSANANHLAIVGGDTQAAAVGAALPSPLVVKVTDGFGNPIGGVAITWSVTGGGSVSAASTPTAADGTARVTRTLGPAAGTQTTIATSAGLAGSPLTFTHTAIAGSPNTLTVVSGNDQQGVAGTVLANPLVVRVADANNNPLSGKPVSWVVTGGGGSVSATSTTTDASGQASVRWTLGPRSGTNTLNAVVSGVGTAGFSATATQTPGQTPASVVKHGGDNQSGTVGTGLPTPLSVQVLNAAGAPVSGVQVAWAAGGGGSVNPTSSTTDASGVAQTTRVLGNTAGQETTTATVSGLPPVTFTSTATPGAPPQIVITRQASPQAISGQPFQQQPVVQLRTSGGQPLPQAGVDVVVAINSGGGSLGGTTTVTTDVGGQAVFTDLSITGTSGPRKLIFAASGFTSVTSSTIDVQQPAPPPPPPPPPPPTPSQANSSISAPPSGTAGQPVTVTVVVHDASNAPIAGATVAFSVTNSNGSFTPQSTTTDANGQAVTQYTPATAASETITADVSANGGSIQLTTGFTASSVGTGGMRLGFLTQPPPSVRANHDIKPGVTIAVQDASGKTVASATNTISLALSGGTPGATLSHASSTAQKGVAKFNELRVSDPGDGYRLVATAAGLRSDTSIAFAVVP